MPRRITVDLETLTSDLGGLSGLPNGLTSLSDALTSLSAASTFVIGALISLSDALISLIGRLISFSDALTFVIGRLISDVFWRVLSIKALKYRYLYKKSQWQDFSTVNHWWRRWRLGAGSVVAFENNRAVDPSP